eukprot:c2996_g1_i1.p1 GENE.c2996_g1_i1~~c2996_g1_i1.p1  ORF type:complete len:506 (+),score=105.36 c2996_g1_i1:13-1530(+)
MSEAWRRLLPQKDNSGSSPSPATIEGFPLTELTLPLHPGRSADVQTEANEAQTQVPPTTHLDLEDEGEDMPEKFAAQIMSLMKPVSCCLILVVYLVRTVGQGTGGGFSQVMVYQESENDKGSKRFAGAFLNMLMFIVVIFVVTTVLVLLYKLRCTKLIFAWLILSCATLLGVFTMYIGAELLSIYNLALDSISFYALLWNFAVVGVLSIFWHAPLLVKQCYLIVMSAMMAWTLTKLPAWTTWGVLTGVSLWDLFAVLSPVGPLKMLLKESQSRGESIPGLVYETSQVSVVDRARRPVRPNPIAALSESANQSYGTPTESHRTNTQNQIVQSPVSTRSSVVPQASPSARVETETSRGDVQQPPQPLPQQSQQPQQQQEQQQQQQREQQPQQSQSQQSERAAAAAAAQAEDDDDDDDGGGIKLGLGDFIFYSVLIARAALLDTWPTVVTCFLALITGLCLTLFFLALLRKPLPALPMSISLGIVFYFATSALVDPFLKTLLENQVFL